MTQPISLPRKRQGNLFRLHSISYIVTNKTLIHNILYSVLTFLPLIFDVPSKFQMKMMHPHPHGPSFCRNLSTVLGSAPTDLSPLFPPSSRRIYHRRRVSSLIYTDQALGSSHIGSYNEARSGPSSDVQREAHDDWRIISCEVLP